MSTKPGVTSLPLASISSAPRPATLPTCDDPAAGDRDVGLEGLAAAAVDHGAAADHQIQIGHGTSPSLCRQDGPGDGPVNQLPAGASSPERRRNRNMAKILLIHGAYQGGWIWTRVAERLRAAGHRVLAPSLDGCAERAQRAPRHHHREPGRGDRLPAVLRGLDATVVLAGTCTGGMVMCRLAELAPRADRPAGLRRCAGAAWMARSCPTSSPARPRSTPR